MLKTLIATIIIILGMIMIFGPFVYGNIITELGVSFTLIICILGFILVSGSSAYLDRKFVRNKESRFG